MENGKIQNSEFETDQVEFSNNGPILGFLNRTIQQKHKHLKASFVGSQISKRQSTAESLCPDPLYKFKITGFDVKDAVQYQVQLVENREIRGRTCRRVYQFATRYSKLLALHQKLAPSAEFPPKKLFNSKNPDFLEKRRSQLEAYLNKIASSESKVFRQFVTQIKKATENSHLKI